MVEIRRVHAFIAHPLRRCPAMSLYSILLSTMFPNNTPPFDNGFSEPQTSAPAYSDAMLRFATLFLDPS